jgi:hypothetical protein
MAKGEFFTMSSEVSTPGFWNCDKDAPLGRLAFAFGVPETYWVEISAFDWDDDAHVLDELQRAFSFPDGFTRSWEGVSEALEGFRSVRPKCFFVFRDIPESTAARDNIARAADLLMAGFPAPEDQQIVLDDWNAATLEVRWPTATRTWPVRPLKTS